MPKQSLSRLTWSEERQRYELQTQGQLQLSIEPGNEQGWQDWLTTHTSFAFQGRQGRMSVIKETRARGAGYWYAYGTRHRRTSKRYLGSTGRMTLARLEEEALAFAQVAAPPQMDNMVIPGRGEPAVSFLATSSQPGLPLVATKLAHPRLPATLVEREYLQTRLEEAISRPFTLLSASGGWGKTTLLSAWATRSSHAIAWLSLDEVDNDPPRFWTSVIAALRTRFPAIGASAFTMLRIPQPPRLSIILATLLNELHTLTQKAVLILDDYHLIEEQAIHESVHYFLDHLPESLHVILSSRVDPPFPLARWRARGQMSELRDSDLHFQQEEATRFLLQSMGLSLSEAEVGALESRTEGWIAGLQLAALAMQQREDHAAFIQAFSGSHRYLLDYVQEDILARLPEDQHEFLLQTAILSRLSAELCQAITEEPASQELLETIERANLFLVPLDEERRWYRFHELFREALLARLKATRPALVSCLHQRAARWYEAHDSLVEAIAHALSAEDVSYAASLMERAAPQMWLVGEAKTVHSWVSALPDSVLREHLNLAITAVLHLLHRIFGATEEQQVKAVGRTVDRVENLLANASHLPEAEATLLRNRIRMFHIWGMTSRAIAAGDMEQLLLHCQQMQPLALGDEVLWQMAPLFLNVIYSMYFLVDCHSLRHQLLEAKQLARREQKPYEFLRIGQWLAQISWLSGQLHRAHQECLEMLHIVEQEHGQALSIDGYLHLTLARLYRTWNQLGEARAHLHYVLQHAQTLQYMPLQLEGYDTLVELSLDTGDLAGAEQALQEVERLIQQNTIAICPPAVMSAQMRLWLAQGDLATAGAWATRYRIRLDALEASILWDEHLALTYVYLKQRRYAEALHVLTTLLSNAERGKREGQIAHILALQVTALEALGERERARQVLVHLLNVTKPEGYVRVYLDAGEPMRRMLQSFLDAPGDDAAALSATTTDYALTLLAHFEQKESTATQVTQPSSYTGPASAQPGLHEPLSPQEQRVLRLLVAGHTYAEMAQELIVSQNTVKTHVSSIYRKLDVRRRAEASALAQRLHLL